jgi:asparagine synthase (glutamine-hydrolysing)
VGNQAFASGFFGKDLADTGQPGYAHGARWATTKRLWNFFSADVRQGLSESALERGLLDDLPARFGDWEGLARDQYVEAKTLLAGYLLSSQGDRVAMANSVEGRVPFLDHRVVEFASRLPARFKIRGLREKAVLKMALGGLLPREIVTRVKQPYRAPDAPSFFVNGKPLDYVEELLSVERVRGAGYFDPAAVSRLFEKCRTGRAIGFSDNMAFVGIVSTMLVHDQFVL